MGPQLWPFLMSCMAWSESLTLLLTERPYLQERLPMPLLLEVKFRRDQGSAVPCDTGGSSREHQGA